MKIKHYALLLFLFGLSFSFQACKVVPSKSPVILQEEATLKTFTDTLLSQIQAAPTPRTYSQFNGKYNAIVVLYDSIGAQQSRRDKSKNFSTQVANARSSFVELQGYHRNKDNLTDTEIHLITEQLDALIAPIIYAELKLK